MTPDPEHPVIQDEHAELRRNLDVGLARIEGHLALLTQRDEQSTKELDDLATRITALEHSRWPLAAVATLAAVGALAVALWQALGR
ncbi:hypothetical protein ACIBI4_11495 [Streptomyces sp. NPDC050418]|uniref:hypothetical protein n=1 Tax=Streptomyces sp. NPDC050418 TaxID=3365612 RepID=UPI00378AAB7E